MPFSVVHLDHVEVFVSDLEESVHWYEKIFGFREMHLIEELGCSRWTAEHAWVHRRSL